MCCYLVLRTLFWLSVIWFLCLVCCPKMAFSCLFIVIGKIWLFGHFTHPPKSLIRCVSVIFIKFLVNLNYKVYPKALFLLCMTLFTFSFYNIVSLKRLIAILFISPNVLLLVLYLNLLVFRLKFSNKLFRLYNDSKKLNNSCTALLRYSSLCFSPKHVTIGYLLL